MKTKTFVCNHQIFLTENQRYDLFACIPVKTYGIFLQAEIVKSMNAKNIQEIFCAYEIDCKVTNKPLEFKNNIIKIHIQPVDKFRNLLEDLETNQKNKLIGSDDDNIDMKDLLNYEEGGKESLFFETIQINSKKNNKNYHKVEIKDILEYEKSIEFVTFSNLKESY
jgi:hypothetical protein